MSTAKSGHKKVRIGVFIPNDAQLLDTACVDILGTMSYEYLGPQAVVPNAVSDLAPSVEICYIGSRSAGELISLTSEAAIHQTHHMSDPAVAPGTLDIVFVPGPDPSSEVTKEAADWLALQAARQETDILSVCTGIYVCGAAGLVKGRSVCGPRLLQGELKKKFEGGTWVGANYRWWQDGNFWSSGM